MLYKKNTAGTLSDSLFRHPTSEYRGTPFWAWNCKLEKDELLRQIDVFQEMGLGGFHMHVRTGLATEYLSDEYMGMVRACVDKAKQNNMLAWLYDEDRWPSGAAGGLVTKEEKYRSRYLLFTPTPYEDGEHNINVNDSRAEGGRNGKGRLLAVYDVTLDEKGFLVDYRRISETDAATGDKWYAYLEICSPSGWYNNQTYVDTLNKDAIKRFLNVTHERYKEYLQADFGDTVPAIFTDEPQFPRKHTFNNSSDKDDLNLPWTDATAESYLACYQEDILDFLPELFWDLPDGKVSVHRYRYHDHIAETFANAFADTCGEWCRANGIALTGHMMEEPTLESQTAALGEAMRSYRGFDLPGIDMLCARYELTTAKQAQSAVHQFGREGMLSELYGVTGWDYDFRGHKLQGDWQAALGVTIRVPHLSWVSMAGEAKRDYPASISYQSPWYREYSYVEDHFARVNTAMTRGKPVVRVGVIHPVESFWLHWGPNDQSGLLRSAMDEKFQNLTSWLLEGSIDFNFISESLLPSLCKEGANPLPVGEMTYDAVVVPDCETLRSSTLARLEQFAAAGGKLIFMGNAPQYENAEPSARGRNLYEKSIRVSYDRANLLLALADNRTVTLRKKDGSLTDRFVYQMRQDTDCRWLFIAHCKDPYNADVFRSEDLRVVLPGIHKITVYDTISGETHPADVDYLGKQTIVKKKMYDYDSLLLKIEDGRQETAADSCAKAPQTPITLSEQMAYSMDEPNVLLLDQCEFKVDDGAYLPKEEILRADNVARDLLGLDRRGGSIPQPWVITPETPRHTITLKFTVQSEIAVEKPILALEDAQAAVITLNGETVASTVIGWYVDKAIKTVALPPLQKGNNVLTVQLPIGNRTNTEWCYILGDFGVRAAGRSAVIIAKPEKITFGDVTEQGFPFYGGNLTYHLGAIECGDALTVQAQQYRGSLIKVFIDGKDCGIIAYSPNLLRVEGLTKGAHTVDIRLFTNRFNAFGAVHCTDRNATWHGPNAWRTTAENWSYEYNLRPVGILSAPIIKA